MAKSEKTNITWSDEHQRLAEIVVKKHAGRMGEAGIPTRSSTRPGGESSINRSGAVLFALKLAAGEVPEK